MKTIETQRFYFRFLLAAIVTLMIFAREAEAQRPTNRIDAVPARHAAGLEKPSGVLISASDAYLYTKSAYQPAHGYVISPRWTSFVFKQFVSLDSRRPRASEIEVRTHLKRRVTDSNRRSRRIDFKIERVVLLENGRRIGEVRRIPSRFANVRANISRNGRIEFEEMTFLAGDPYLGFEMISSDLERSYSLRDALRNRRTKVGVLDLRRERVREVRSSQFVNEGGRRNVALIPLVPENDQWGLGYALDDFRGSRYGRGNVRGSRNLFGLSASFNSGVMGSGFRVDDRSFRFNQEVPYETGNGRQGKMLRRVEIERGEL